MPIDCGRKYNEERKLVVDWSPVCDVNLNDIYSPAFVRDCAHIANVERKKLHVYRFVVVFVLQLDEVQLDNYKEVFLFNVL